MNSWRTPDMLPFGVGDMVMAFYPQLGRMASEYCGRVRSIEAEPAVGHTECFVELESWPMAAEGLYKPDTTENDWREAQPFWPLLQKLEAAHFRPAPFSGTGIQLTHAGQERVSGRRASGRRRCSARWRWPV